MNQDLTPIYSALMEHTHKNPISFHVPGHKFGKVFPMKGNTTFSSLLKIDATEIEGLDDLHSPEGIIQEAQSLTAEWYNVQQSYFLVGGSTAGNLAMILSVCQQGDIVFVQRNCHKSVIHGLHLSGVSPVFLSPEIEREGNLPVGITLDTMEKAFKKYPNAKAVILTYPNYYGMAIRDIEKVISFAHSHQMPVLVDEAHGAHFCLGRPFPLSAIDFGADVTVQSAHKTLPAMTMGSYLHLNSTLIDQRKLEYYLQVFQTSSPSYPVMASLDLARYFLSHLTEQDINGILKGIDQFNQKMNSIPQLKVLSQGQHYDQDPLKVLIQTRCELSGYQLQVLFAESSVYTELADPHHVLFVLPLHKLNEELIWIDKIKEVLSGFEVQEAVSSFEFKSQRNDVSSLSLSYKDFVKLPKKYISLEQAKGYISATNVIPYPPGIPVLMIGEEITQEHLDTISELKRKGAKFQNGDIWTEGLKVFEKRM